VVTNLVKFILLFVLIAQFVALNASIPKKIDGKAVEPFESAGMGMQYYLASAPFPLPADAAGEVKYKQSGGSDSKDLF
jgi:hypothetical protein